MLLDLLTYCAAHAMRTYWRAHGSHIQRWLRSTRGGTIQEVQVTECAQSSVYYTTENRPRLEHKYQTAPVQRSCVVGYGLQARTQYHTAYETRLCPVQCDHFVQVMHTRPDRYARVTLLLSDGSEVSAGTYEPPPSTETIRVLAEQHLRRGARIAYTAWLGGGICVADAAAVRAFHHAVHAQRNDDTYHPESIRWSLMVCCGPLVALALLAVAIYVAHRLA